MNLASTVERRLLVNYRVDPDVAAGLLPPEFRPQIVNGYAVAGICLIRLGATRPSGVPEALGLRSENAAHRIAVEWDGGAGVYIPRRHTSSELNRLAGNRVFPGHHERADFTVEERKDRIYVSVKGDESVDVAVRVADELRGSELFAGVDEASRFFERGEVEYSLSRSSGGRRSPQGDASQRSEASGRVFAGLKLATSEWRVDPVRVDWVRSSYFDRLPAGAATLDCALLMRDVPVTWQALGTLPAAA